MIKMYKFKSKNVYQTFNGSLFAGIATNTGKQSNDIHNKS